MPDTKITVTTNSDYGGVSSGAFYSANFYTAGEASGYGAEWGMTRMQIPVPKNAIIISAIYRLRPSGSPVTPYPVTFQFINADNESGALALGDFSKATATTVTGSLTDTSVMQAYEIKDALQPIVNRAGWVSGNYAKLKVGTTSNESTSWYTSASGTQYQHTLEIRYSTEAGTEVTATVAVNGDDADVRSGTLYNDSYLYLTDATASYGAISPILRFALDVPKDAVIQSALVRLKWNYVYTDNLPLTFAFLNEANSTSPVALGDFSKAVYPITTSDNRSQYLDAGKVMDFIVTNILQQVVNHAGWVSGNGCKLKISGGGASESHFVSKEGGYTSSLIVYYTAGGPNPGPFVRKVILI